MPAQKRARRHEERSLPRRSGQHTTERPQKHAVRRCELGTSYLALQHPQLVAEEQDLDLLLAL
jgi:hypothetical protein